MRRALLIHSSELFVFVTWRSPEMKGEMKNVLFPPPSPAIEWIAGDCSVFQVTHSNSMLHVMRL